jgi:prepilin-type processing-associated H-X9-DG protein
MPANFADGTSNTIAIGEKFGRCRGDGTNANAGTLWAHGWWNPEWEPRFNTWFNRGTASKFQVQPLPHLASAPCVPSKPQSNHTGGMNTALWDGSVRFLSANIDPNTWWAACTPAGGETLGSNW